MADNKIYINFDEGLKRMMNNASFYAKMLVKFKNNNTMKDVEEALAGGDMEKAQTACHTLKGTAGNLSLTELHLQSLELETQIKSNSVNPGQLSVLKSTFTETLAEIEKVITKYA
ncbi:MAG: Hpt domain-containing protein [Treponema sp.]|jgi:HPt (histidine-containing phosphotransfer) domain-containing protein|nr:Hpt domain-containing protein [Treponema sp.]